jgi:hypothetical protein
MCHSFDTIDNHCQFDTFCWTLFVKRRNLARSLGKVSYFCGTSVALSASMTQLTIERALRLGKHPKDIGATELSAGAQKMAYAITTKHGTKFVIKENSGGYGNHEQIRPPNLRKYGCSSIRQHRAGNWIIQEQVTPLRVRCSTTILVPKTNPAWKVFHKINAHEYGDYHSANFGIRASDGKLVCFDW